MLVSGTFKLFVSGSGEKVVTGGDRLVIEGGSISEVGVRSELVAGGVVPFKA